MVSVSLSFYSKSFRSFRFDLCLLCFLLLFCCFTYCSCAFHFYSSQYCNKQAKFVWRMYLAIFVNNAPKEAKVQQPTPLNAHVRVLTYVRTYTYVLVCTAVGRPSRVLLVAVTTDYRLPPPPPIDHALFLYI